MDAKTENPISPVVGIIMGSSSDGKTMRPAAEVLTEFGIAYEAKVVSAHRTPDYLFEYAGTAEKRGLSLIIAGAGGAAHLPGMAAAKTIVPVIGVPVEATPLQGLDALLSIMQMPAEVGVATVCVGPIGAHNAAMFAVATLASRDTGLRKLLRARREALPAIEPLSKAGNRVAILARQESEFEILQHSRSYLQSLGVEQDTVIVSPDETPDRLSRRLADLEGGGVGVFIAGSAGGVAFACEISRATPLPVLAVPISPPPMSHIDEFLRSFLDMPPGVATFAIGKPGAINAALFAAAILSGHGSATWAELNRIRAEQVKKVRAMTPWPV